MLPELVVRFVMVALDGRLLDRSVHPFDLAVCPRVTQFGGTVLDVEIGECCFEGVAAEGLFLCPHLLDVLGCPAIAGRIGEVRSIVGKHGVDPVGHGCGEVPQEVAGHPASGFFVQIREGELEGPVDRHQQVEFPFARFSTLLRLARTLAASALLGSYLGEIDVEVADRLRLELLPDRFVAIDLGQAAYTMAVQASMQQGACQARDRGL